ncbi:MAG: alpha/beta fold hydrolase [Bacilli bacterium]|nr:alpha/beta fold hydrolase [Bacilli bacterium]
MKKEKSCGAVVIKKENDGIKFLIIRQHDDCWHFPKGHVEEGETEEETAIREIKEETNIDVEIDNGFRKVITYSPKAGVMKDVVFFIGKTISDDLVIDPNELLEAKWVNIKEAKEYFYYEDTIDTFEAAIEYLYENGYFYDYYIPENCKRVFIMLHGYSSDMYGSTNTCVKEKCKGTDTGYIAFDLPGHNSNSENLSLKKCFDLIERVNSFIDKKQANVEKIILGMSFGGYLALISAIKNPDRYSKIILRSPALKMYESLYKFNKQAIDNHKQIVFGVPIEKDFIEELKNTDIFDMDITIDTDKLLIIHGDNDEVASLQDVVSFIDKYGGHLKIIKGAGHSFNENDLEEMYNYIDEFIN